MPSVVRSTMAELITEVRGLISDPNAMIFTDADVQDALDRHRDDARNLRLEEVEQPTPGTGVLVWNDYYAPWGAWETDMVFQTGRGPWTVLAPSPADYLTGKFTFTGQLPPIYIQQGKTYDIYLAARDLLRRMAALTVLNDFDVESDGQHLSRSQRQKGLLALAKEYEGMARVGSGEIYRSDVAGQ